MERPTIKHTQIFINNEFVNSVSGKTFETIDPATENVICQIQEGDKADIDKAVVAARKAFEYNSKWRKMDASNRGHLLYKLSDLIERDAKIIAKLDAIDCGKTVDSALGDVEFALKHLRYYAGWADKIHGKTIPVDGPFYTFTRKEAVGVIGAIIPWNYPFHLAIMKLGPALTCGNTIVLKPAEETPLSVLHLAALCKEIGFPPGVINIVPGFGETAGAALAEHPDVDGITFTGSTQVGQSITKASAVNIKRVKLELGGKSPLIIFDDADIETAAIIAHEACMVNSGQCCSAGTRTYVQASIYDKMIERFKDLAETRKLGGQFDPSTVQGPQINKVQFDTIMSYIESGKKEGARLVTGGERHGNKGYFIKPTVFADVKQEMKIAKEEIFGPVQCVIKFDTMEEVIKAANDSKYGLAAAVCTTDMDKAMVMTQALRAGSMWVNSYQEVFHNAPFGGYKMSGIGRELGQDGLDFYMETKTITLPMSQKSS